MKGLVKKVLVPLTIAGTLFATNPVFAEIRPFVSVDIDRHYGLAQLAEIQDIYGSMYRVRGATGLEFKNFRLEGALAYMEKEESNNIRNSNLSILQKEVIASYKIPKFRNLHIGGGLTFIDLTKKSSTAYSKILDQEINKKTSGMIFTVGADILLIKKKRYISGEISKFPSGILLNCKVCF